MKTARGDLMLPTREKPCFCSTRNVGITVFHGHVAALVTTRHMNKNAGFRKYKVVIIDRHFKVVDHTWERNTS